jgi:hypothetical protein
MCFRPLLSTTPLRSPSSFLLLWRKLSNQLLRHVLALKFPSKMLLSFLHSRFRFFPSATTVVACLVVNSRSYYGKAGEILTAFHNAQKPTTEAMNATDGPVLTTNNLDETEFVEDSIQVGIISLLKEEVLEFGECLGFEQEVIAQNDFVR